MPAGAPHTPRSIYHMHTYDLIPRLLWVERRLDDLDGGHPQVLRSPLSFTPAKPPHKSTTNTVDGPERSSGQRTDHNAHTQRHTRYCITGLAQATIQRQGHNGAGKQAQALTFRAFTLRLGYNTHQHHRPQWGQQNTECAPTPWFTCPQSM